MYKFQYTSPCSSKYAELGSLQIKRPEDVHNFCFKICSSLSNTTDCKICLRQAIL